VQEKFDQTLNFDFCFWPNNWEYPHRMSIKFGLWMFHKLWKKQKKFTLLAFGCLHQNNHTRNNSPKQPH